VRTRITTTVAALVLLALTAAGLIIYVLESARVESAARDQAEQEVAEFRALQADGLDPTTARPFTNAQDLLDVFLSRNVPSDDELLIGWIDGRARYVSAGRHGALAEDPTLVRAVTSLLPSGSERTIRTPYGEVLVTVQPVQEPTGERAGLVVATFMDDARAELRSLVQTYAVVSLLSLAGIVAIAAWVAGRLLAPIRRLNDTARAISATDLSARLPVTGNDDITALTLTANQMLERLETAFAAQRQFLDDAGHELRTPLTVLRGHLELLYHSDPADLAETRELLLDEVDRMARLVGDLILLAKSRRPDFLVPGEVDLDQLTAALLGKARALGDRDWRLDGSARGTVVLDEQRVTQAVLQLADNAVKHTDPGDLVAIGSTRTADDVRLWVRDTGGGIAEEDRETVLERFGRSRVRPGDDGFGLGLSIVRAIAEAHGGSVSVRDAEPRGTLVEIVLPAGPSPGPDKSDWTDTVTIDLAEAEEATWRRS
jgi:signal transduction histidine kinase